MSAGPGFRRLISISAVYAGTRALLSGSRFLLIPIYLHYLAPAQYGILGTTSTISSALAVLLLGGMERAALREYFDYSQNPIQLRSYLTSIYGFLLVLNAAAILVAIVVGPSVTRLILGSTISFSPYILTALLIASATAFYAVLMVFLQVQERALTYAAVQIGRFATMLAMTLWFVTRLGAGAIGVLLAELLATCGAVIVLGVIQLADVKRFSCGSDGHNDVRVSFDRAKVRKALVYGLPFIPYEIFWWVITGADRILLARFRSLDEVGLYTLAASLAMGLSILTVGINLAYSPYFFKVAAAHENEHEPPSILAHMAEAYILGVGAFCLAGMLFSREVLGVFAPARYSGAQPAIPILLFSAFVGGLFSMVVMPLFHLKQTTRLPLFAGVAALLNISWNLALVPRWGMIGAAWGNLGANSVLLLLAYRAARARYRIRYAADSFWGALCLIGISGLLLASLPLSQKIGAFAMVLAVIAYTNRAKLNLLAAAEPT